ncbi:VOC family protein [Antrihabitans cavernicola]|uniref:VOC family protein n=1 Tax=Antrihabitans cavernicola TaxID=2495913 RepID=A0A5A7SEU4_9NOCA|nr:VOC family protein [Spelaeibacter cavernicola]KAA0023949.1 VOC family protein [Spelaeibacter cavernicola]
MNRQPWPNGFDVAQIRISRPTDRLDAVIGFYETDLGLLRIGDFVDHAGWDGVMLGLPGTDVHLEFTSHVDGTPCPAPTSENVVVLYFPDESAMSTAAERMTAAGHDPVELDNPYWAANGGVAFEDPDGWRVLLMPTALV